MSDDAQTPPSEPAPTAEAPAAEPEWKGDLYLTSGARFRRWNLITLILGLILLGGGWVALNKQRKADQDAKRLEAEGGY